MVLVQNFGGNNVEILDASSYLLSSMPALLKCQRGSTKILNDFTISCCLSFTSLSCTYSAVPCQ